MVNFSAARRKSVDNRTGYIVVAEGLCTSASVRPIGGTDPFPKKTLHSFGTSEIASPSNIGVPESRIYPFQPEQIENFLLRLGVELFGIKTSCSESSRD